MVNRIEGELRCVGCTSEHRSVAVRAARLIYQEYVVCGYCWRVARDMMYPSLSPPRVGWFGRLVAGALLFLDPDGCGERINRVAALRGFFSVSSIEGSVFVSSVCYQSGSMRHVVRVIAARDSAYGRDSEVAHRAAYREVCNQESPDLLDRIARRVDAISWAVSYMPKDVKFDRLALPDVAESGEGARRVEFVRRTVEENRPSDLDARFADAAPEAWRVYRKALLRRLVYLELNLLMACRAALREFGHSEEEVMSWTRDTWTVICRLVAVEEGRGSELAAFSDEWLDSVV